MGAGGVGVEVGGGLEAGGGGLSVQLRNHCSPHLPKTIVKKNPRKKTFKKIIVNKLKKNHGKKTLKKPS